MLEQRHIGEAVELGQANGFAERPDARRGVPASTQPGNCRHAGIVPAVDMPFLHKRQQLTLAQDGVGQVQSGELNLARVAINLNIIQHPVVKRPVHLKLQCAQRVGDALNRVRQAVREIVHRVDTPLVTGAVMLRFADAIQHRIAHVQVRRGHVDLRPQHPRAVLEFSVPHTLEQLEIFLRRPIAVRTVFAGASRGAAMLGDLVQRQVTDKCLTIFNQLNRVAVKFLKIVRREVKIFAPVKTKPSHILLDRVHVLDVLLHRVGVVET